jgi:hypothetical protein
MASFPQPPQYTPPLVEVDGREIFVQQWADWFLKVAQYISATGAFGGVLPVAGGGTGISAYAVGDLLYANTAASLARLADVATGNALISGGVGVAPAWGKVTLTTHVSGILPGANGGTGVNNGTSTVTIGGNVSFSGAFTFTGTVTGNTTVTFPTTGTLATTAQLPVGQNYTGTLRPPKDDGTAQTACALYAGSGAPNNANGANGDYYFRSDGGVGTYIYFKTGGAWGGIL